MSNMITSLLKKIQHIRTKNMIKKYDKNNTIIIDDNVLGNLKLDIQGKNNIIRLTNISIPAIKNRKIIYIYLW